MAKAKATTEYDKAVKALIKEYKKTGSIQYDELSDKLAAPYKLDASGIDKLLQKV
ncbi:MAG: RNA polymerase sigma factor RpoD, partial [Loigolactobacillus coryniformis]|jgi:RNA polymerase primary sigma factor|nr:RNA polymerase sigma factor RpoD [Loigolactobacillus coryniformis]